MVMSKRTVIDFSDLQFLSIECSTCGTRLVIDVTRKNRDVPESCSACKESFGALKNQVGAFIRVYVAIAESGGLVRFEINGQTDDHSRLT